MSEQHTPGPWKLHHPTPHDFRILAPSGEAPTTIARLAVAQAGTSRRVNANARLIAAAPELLEACRGIMYAFDGEHIDAGEWHAEIDELRAAIAATTGESRE